eukprot:4995208-Prymnesium_polylepis.4
MACVPSLPEMPTPTFACCIIATSFLPSPIASVIGDPGLCRTYRTRGLLRRRYAARNDCLALGEHRLQQLSQCTVRRD